MLSRSIADSGPLPSTLGPRTETESSPVPAGHVRFRCSDCPYTSASYDDGRCPCGRIEQGTEIECRGILVAAPLWCGAGQHEVLSLATTGGESGPACHSCADEWMERTQRIPHETLADIAAEWRRIQGVAA